MDTAVPRTTMPMIELILTVKFPHVEFDLPLTYDTWDEFLGRVRSDIRELSEREGLKHGQLNKVVINLCLDKDDITGEAEVVITPENWASVFNSDWPGWLRKEYEAIAVAGVVIPE